jgi:hypothetical protein
MLKLALAALVLGAASAAPLPTVLPPPPPTNCPVVVLRDYELGWAYYAQVRLVPECPEGGSARVRKTSTLSTKVNGNPYQPIRPETGAWNVTRQGDNIPNSMQFTLYNWAWEYSDGKHWIFAETR